MGEREKKRRELTPEVRAFLDGLATLIAEDIQEEQDGANDGEVAINERGDG